VIEIKLDAKAMTKKAIDNLVKNRMDGIITEALEEEIRKISKSKEFKAEVKKLTAAAIKKKLPGLIDDLTKDLWLERF